MPYYQHRFDRVDQYLHHRSPYLLVDQIEAIEDREIRTCKTLNADDCIFQGHFPGAPIYPGAMMQELITQSAGILIAANFNPMESYDTADPHHNEFALGVLASVQSARYRHFARPGDHLAARVTLHELTGTLFDFTGAIHVGTQELMRIAFRLANIPSASLTENPG